MMHNADILDDFAFDDEPEWSGEGEVVAKFYSVMEAELAAARLRSEGIHCFLANSISQSVVPHLQGFVRLHTRPKDADRAREIIQEAAVDSDNPLPHKNSGTAAMLVVSILIGLALAWLLVQAID